MTKFESQLVVHILKVIKEREEMEQRIREIERDLLTPRAVVKLGKMKLYLN